MKKYFYEYGQLNWFYVLFGAIVVGFLIAFFAAMFSNGASVAFFAIHSGDSYSLFKIWKIFTYSLADVGIFSVVSNLFWLWLFGDILASIYGTKKVFQLYCVTTILIGLIAGIFCLFAKDRFIIELLGCTPALIAIAAAAVYKMPYYKISFMMLSAIPLWIIGVIFLLLRIFISPTTQMAFMLILSLMALAIGFLYVKLLDNGSALLNWNFNFNWKSNSNKKSSEKGRVVAMNRKPTVTPKDDKQEQLNKILDKISAVGMNGLTNEEKAFLESYSKQD